MDQYHLRMIKWFAKNMKWILYGWVIALFFNVFWVQLICHYTMYWERNQQHGKGLLYNRGISYWGFWDLYNSMQCWFLYYNSLWYIIVLLKGTKKICFFLILPFPDKAVQKYFLKIKNFWWKKCTRFLKLILNQILTTYKNNHEVNEELNKRHVLLFRY